jgi:hypothetical protein
MEPMTRVPQSRVYHLTVEGMHFTVTKTLVHQGWRSGSAPLSSSSWTPHRSSVWAWTASSPTLARVGAISVPPSFNSRWHPRSSLFLPASYQHHLAAHTKGISSRLTHRVRARPNASDRTGAPVSHAPVVRRIRTDASSPTHPD